MSVVKEMNVDKLKIMVFDTRKALGVEAAKQAAAKVRELSAKKNEINIIFAAAPSQNEFLEAFLKEDIEWGKINAFHMAAMERTEPYRDCLNWQVCLM